LLATLLEVGVDMTLGCVWATFCASPIFSFWSTVLLTTRL
jgi:hypothetical protein